MTKISALTVAAAVASALAFSAATSIPAAAQGKHKCYGVSKAGQNDCAPASGAHSCAGQSKVDFDGGDWKGVKDSAACSAMGGKDAPFKGKNPTAPKA
jgi:uncharacterized membrane protein